MVKSACCWKWPVKPHRNARSRHPGGQKKEKNRSASRQGKMPFRQFPARGVQSAGHGGAEREGEERLKPSPQEQNHGSARYSRPAHSRECAGRERRDGMVWEGWVKSQSVQGRRRHSIAYFPAKKSFHSIGIRKIPVANAARGLGIVLYQSRRKWVKRDRIRCRSGRIHSVPLQCGEDGCISPCGRNGSRSRF